MKLAWPSASKMAKEKCEFESLEMTFQYSNLWVSFEALKFQMPRKSKNCKISSRTAGEKIKTRVSRLRKLALSERNNRGYFLTAKGTQTVTGRLLARFRKSDALAWPSRLRIRAGLENELIFSLSQVSGTSQDVLEGNRSAAMMHARGVLFDELISESLIQAGWGRLNCMSYAHMAAELFDDPYRIVSDQWLAETFAKGMCRHPTAFINGLKEIQHNLERRKKTLSNHCLYLMAANWTNAHCPMWLMTREAIFQTCAGLSEGLEITQEMVNERLKKSNLRRNPHSPIVGVKLNASSEIEGFAVSNKYLQHFRCWEFKNSSCIAYTAFKPAKKYRVDRD